MTNQSRFISALKFFGRLIVTSLFLLAYSAAEPSDHMDWSVEIYEMAEVQAFALLKIFVHGSQEDRQRVLDIMRGSSPPQGMKILAMGQVACRLDTHSSIRNSKEHIYPSGFTPSQDGISSPSAFEFRPAGTSAGVRIKRSETAGVFLVEADIRTEELLSKTGTAAAAAATKGWQPVFVSSVIKTSLEMTAGIPRLLGIYAPHPEVKSGAVLRVAIATLEGSGPFQAPPPPQTDACVEVYEMPLATATAFKKTFDESAAAARSDLLQQLRGSTKLCAMGHRAFKPGVKSEVSSIKEYHYPQSYYPGPPGVFVPDRTQMTPLGIQMPLEISEGSGTGRFALVTTTVKDIERVSPAADYELKLDDKGMPVAPVFNTTEINTSPELENGIPSLLSSYAPVPGGTMGRLVFVTVHAGN